MMEPGNIKKQAEQEAKEQHTEKELQVKSTKAKAKPKKISEIDKLTQEVTELKSEIDQLKDKNLRLFAEFENLRKRTAKERLELYKTAGEEVITSLLTILDDFDRGIDQLEKHDGSKGSLEGITLIFNKFKAILENQGLKEMESIGQEFNVEYHDAITEAPAPSRKMKGKVIDEIEKGYFLNDKIIRHAKVVVGK